MSSCIWLPGKIHTRPWGHYLSTGPLSHDKRWLYMRGDIITPLSVQRWPLLSDVNGLFPPSLDVHQLLIDYLDPFTVDAVTSRTCFQSLYPEFVWCHTPPQCFSQGGGFCLEDVQADLMPELSTYTVWPPLITWQDSDLRSCDDTWAASICWRRPGDLDKSFWNSWVSDPCVSNIYHEHWWCVFPACPTLREKQAAV